MTRREATLSTDVKDTISSRPTSANAWSRTAMPASVANPFPHADSASRQPISTQGVKAASKRGTDNPTKPTKSGPSTTSTAHRPKPCSAEPASMRSTRASLAARSRGAGKCCITRGSAFMAANGARSSGRQPRSTRRSVASRGIVGRSGCCDPTGSGAIGQLLDEGARVVDRQPTGEVAAHPRVRDTVGRVAVGQQGHGRVLGVVGHRDDRAGTGR